MINRRHPLSAWLPLHRRDPPHPVGTGRKIVALHEAGHAIAALILLDAAEVVAYVEDDRGHAHIHTSHPPANFGEAVAIAAGPAAEALAPWVDLGPPPIAGGSRRAGEPATMAEAIAFDAERTVARSIDWTPTDAERIAAWCTGSAWLAEHPDEWAERHRDVQRAAQRFVREHRSAIVDLAQRLYCNGIATAVAAVFPVPITITKEIP